MARAGAAQHWPWMSPSQDANGVINPVAMFGADLDLVEETYVDYLKGLGYMVAKVDEDSWDANGEYVRVLERL